MFRFLHLADLHLGWTPRYLDSAKAAQRRTRRDSLLERAVDFAVESRIDLVLIAGDLFETHRPDPALVQQVLSQLERLQANGISLLTVPGNHDEITYGDSVYRLHRGEWPGVLVTNPMPEHVATFELAGQRAFVYSLAYTGGVTPAERPLHEFARVEEEGFHLAVFHGTVGGGGERSLPLDRNALAAAGYDYVALGHIHQPQQFDLGRCKVVYSGCQEGKGFDDQGVPYWTVVSVDSSRVEVERVPLAVQRIHLEELDLTDVETADEVAERLDSLADPDALVRLQLTGSLHFPLEVEDLQARWKAHFYHLEIRDDSDSVGPELLEAWAAERTIRGMFVRRMRDELEAAAGDAERRKVVRALRLGIRSFRGTT